MVSTHPVGHQHLNPEGPLPFSFCSSSQENIQVHQKGDGKLTTASSSQLLFPFSFPLSFWYAEPEKLSHPRPWITPEIAGVRPLTSTTRISTCFPISQTHERVDSIFPGQSLPLRSCLEIFEVYGSDIKDSQETPRAETSGCAHLATSISRDE